MSAIASSAAGSGEAQCIQQLMMRTCASPFAEDFIETISMVRSHKKLATAQLWRHCKSSIFPAPRDCLLLLLLFPTSEKLEVGFCFGFTGELASSSSCCFSVDQRDGKLKLSGCSKGLIKRGFWCWFFLSFFLPFFLSCSYLRDNFFTGNIPEELGNLTQLTKLWVAKPPGLEMIFFCTRSWLLWLLQQSGHSFFRFTISSDFFFPIFLATFQLILWGIFGFGLFTSWVCMYVQRSLQQWVNRQHSWIPWLPLQANLSVSIICPLQTCSPLIFRPRASSST